MAVDIILYSSLCHIPNHILLYSSNGIDNTTWQCISLLINLNLVIDL